MTWREKGTTYAVVVPFAIFLAFPFYFALVTMFKTNLDLADVEHSRTPTTTPGRLSLGLLELRDDRARQVLFEDTNYPKWLLNTLLVGAAVVGITLLLAMPAGYALARLAGGGARARGGDLPRLPHPADAPLPALSRLITQLDLKDSLWALSSSIRPSRSPLRPGS